MPCPPNIVYLTGDCFKASAAPVNGNPMTRTPFMTRMAEEGLTFTNAYAPNPICSPSRCSVFTGVHPLVHQVTCHQNRAPLNLPQLPEILQRHGYHTAACGHYELNRNLGRGYDEQCDEAATPLLRESYLTWQKSGRRDIGWPSGRLDLPADRSNSALITDRAIRMLDSAVASGKPFFVHVSYNDPHSPYFAPAPFDTLFDPAAVVLPPRGAPETRPGWHAAALKVFRTDEAGDDDLRRLIAVYYGMIAHLDRQCQHLYDALLERDSLRNTWILIASDHGDYTGEKGMFSHTESLYECLLHVPLILRPPPDNGLPAGTSLPHLVDLVDLFPTVLGIAGITPPSYAQGYDIVKWARQGAPAPLRDAVFAQVGDYHGHLGDSLPGGRPGCTRHPGVVQGVRTREWSYARDPDFGDEAYDLRRDPMELANLIGRETDGVATAIGELRRRVAEWECACLELRDTLKIIPGYRGFDRGWE